MNFCKIAEYMKKKYRYDWAFIFPVFCKISNFDMGESYVLKASFLNSSSFTRVTLLEQPSLVNKQEKKEEKNVPRIWMEWDSKVKIWAHF